MTIPFNKPFVDSRVIDSIRRVIESGKMSGDGTVCKIVEKRLEEMFGAKHVLLTTSGTHALEMAMMIQCSPGDEVIMPSFTFVSTANAALRAGAKPVFCEINDITLTLDPDDFEKRITKNTKAVIPVHYGGIAADMDAIAAIAGRHNIAIIEDAAQGVNARYRGKFLGTIGAMNAYSFHDTKNYVSGEGGAFVTNDEVLARKAEIIREKGTNRANFLRGEVDKYTWVALGSSFVLSDILAAMLDSQLDNLNGIQKRREEIHSMYMNGLADLARMEKLRLPVIPPSCESNYHIFFIVLHDEQERNTVMKRMKEAGISTTFHFIPLHSSPYGREQLGLEGVRLPVTEKISNTLLRLPIYPSLTNDQVSSVIENLRALLR